MSLYKTIGGLTFNLICGLCLMFSMLQVHAGAQPKFNIIPTTPTTKQIPSIGNDTVQYRVTNNTTITRTLTMKPITGVTQVVEGGCSSPFTLAAGASCLLTLNLDGNLLPARVIGGPEICKTKGAGNNNPDPFLCSQPSAANSLNITVVQPSLPTLTSISVTPSASSIANGTFQQFTATGIYSNGTTRNITNLVTWSSSNTNVASVSNTDKGLVTGNSPGQTTISATRGAITGNATLTVTNATLQSITVTPTNESIPRGTTQQYTATGIFTNGAHQDLTPFVTWASSSNAATISNTLGSKGLATATNTGSTTISASFNSITGNTNLTVTAATLNSITITPANPSIPNGVSLQFTATGNFSDGSTHDLTNIVAWTSSTNAAMISNTAGSKGLAIGANPGAATITAVLGAFSGTTTLTVTHAVLNSIEVQPQNSSIANGTTQQFTAIGIFSDNSNHDITNVVTWTSSSGDATISNAAGSKGLATGMQVGSTAITATYGAISGSTTLTITPALLNSITVTPIAPSIANGTSLQFTATGNYSDGSLQDLTSTVTWASSTTAATISNAAGSQGLAVGTNAGQTTISATLGGTSGTTQLTVTSAVLTNIQVLPPNRSIATGTTQQFIAIGIYSDGSHEFLTNQVSWTSSNSGVASISNASGSQGLATGLQVGSSVIAAKLGSISGSTNLTVTPATLSSIEIAPINKSILNKTTQQYTATGFYSDGTRQDLTDTVTWSSSNQSVATISNAAGSEGLATAQAVGTAVITASTGSLSANTNLTVTGITLTAIQIIPSNTSLPNGNSLQFTARGIFANGSMLDLTQYVQWTSSNPSVASISNVQGSKGIATGVSIGSVTITARFNDVSGATPLTITAATLTSIRVSPENLSTPNGTEVGYSAQGTFSDGRVLNLTRFVTWTSSNTNVASISNALGLEGVATTTGAGTTTISASLNGVTGSTPLEVIASPSLTSIEISPGATQVDINTEIQYTAIGHYSNAQSADLTNLVTWTSSNTQVATISNALGAQGSAYTLNEGTTNITATYQGIVSQPSTITVQSNAASHFFITNVGQSKISVCPVNDSGFFQSCYLTTASFNAPQKVAMNTNWQQIYVTNGNNVSICQNTIFPIPDINNCQDSGFAFSTPIGIDILYFLNGSSVTNFAYIANSGNNTVSVCTVAANGTFSSCVDAGGSFTSAPMDILISGSGSSTSATAYITLPSANQVQACTINISNGLFTSCVNMTSSGVPFDNPTGLTFVRGGVTISNFNTNSVLYCTFEQGGMSFNFCENSGNTGVPFAGPMGNFSAEFSHASYIANQSNATVSVCPNYAGNNFFGNCEDAGQYISTGFTGPLFITSNRWIY
ncbi:protein with a bacterial immunoglobulin-like domain protein [Legionella santicrucis]|uniref:Protein with a bacterial immunoglobulin-like domain protein n=1 Tax=Legionella santicrucis TaxID=45074 RepID=A0A0W0YAX3_9GAMM|nr:Ig-like domain-containing protein [Legionella santicrucis]KTD53715.1 protein with a bacterial immunoglobulin-like domain protein [Legionella santicrucis]